ncbi:MAG: ERAP1-like C-terminal domain-containing protein [Gemmatimonadaceae bacterium]|nr:ERAP1-like C-terminal domain-containing protein [Gemmatimonadaceae bacterium]
MIRPITLLALLCSCVAREGCAQSGAPDARLAPGVPHVLATERAAHLRDVRYALTLDVTRPDTAIGTVVVRFAQRSARDVILDFRGLRVLRIDANGATVSPDDPAVWNHAHLRIPARHTRAGTNAITIDFAAPIAAAGASIIRSRDVADGQHYLYTLLVPSDANLLFPCFDQPDLKARVSLTIAAPRHWSVLANGSALRVDSSANGVSHHFAETRPISTYLIAFAAGPYATVSRAQVIAPGAPPTDVRMLVRASRLKEAESDSLIRMNADALRWLGNWFGVPYPFGKYDFLLAPVFPFGGMEHPGAVFYNEQSFIFRERPTISQTLGRQATIFHEVAHQWFGDYVTMRWFDDLWLKEGFATYMAAKMQAAASPGSNAWKTFFLRNKPVAYGTDATAGTTPVWQSLDNLEQAKSNYGPIVYNKAPGVLRQLDYLVGERAFQAGVRAFLAEHAYGNATWRDLLRAIGKSSGRDLTTWGAAWILRPGMPIVEQEVATANGRITRLVLTQRPAQPALSGGSAWPMRTQVLLWYPDAPPVRIPVELSAKRTVVTAATGRRAPAFIFANDGDYGYAIVLPDDASVRWIEMNIGTVKDDLLRAMLWGALWDLVREARLSPSRYAAAALRELPLERDEQIAAALTARIGVAVSRYGSGIARDSLQPALERVLLAGANDTTLAYGQRKSQLDALIGSAQAPASLARLDAWLDGDAAAGLPLRAPTRWAIVTRLVANRYPTASTRLAAEAVRDSSSEGLRQAFVAGAAAPDSATKRAYFARWFDDPSLNEEWVTSSLRAFHDPDHAALTNALMLPSLDTLPWIQKNRRIFFLGAWLNAAIGGQSSDTALQQIDAWLASHPTLAADLRRKVLQSRDELERTVHIRKAFAGSLQ